MTTAIGERPQLAESRPPRRGRGRRLGVVGLSVLALLVGAAVGLGLMLSARSPLLDARAALEEGRDSLLEGELSRAATQFEEARSSFGTAVGRLQNPLTWWASVLPIAGRTPDAVLAGARAGALASAAAGELTNAVRDLPGGPAALAPSDGRMDLHALESLSLPVTRALALIRRAEAFARSGPTSLVPGELSETLDRLVDELAEARHALASADALLSVLPDFLGADGPRRYFLGAQNPAELRGTGGLIGAFAVVTVDRGAISVGPFEDIGALPSIDPATVEPPGPDFDRIYGRYASGGDWSNINMTPDFPSAAVAMERLYERGRDQRLDGVILADPQAFALLLDAAGSVDVPGIGVTLDEEDVLPFVTNEAYVAFPEASVRKRILGAVAGLVLQRFLSGQEVDEPVAAGRALIEAAAGGHLMFHSADPTIQAGLVRAGVGGRLPAGGGDFVAVAVNNASASKIDYYAERAVRYEARLLPGGAVEGRLDVTLRNTAPAEGLPAYVIGPPEGSTGTPGDNVMIVSTYCAPGCRLHGFQRDGTDALVSLDEELGHPVTITGERVGSHGTTTLSYRWTVPQGWDPVRGTYRLTFRGQQTIRPTDVDFLIRAPGSVVKASPGVTVVGGEARWRGRGDIEVDLRLEISAWK
jgi:Protein of unknown function (DUF4012)